MKKRHKKKSLRENVVVYSVTRFQTRPMPNSTTHARQVHRGRIVSEYVQLATCTSVAFVVPNSSLYVDGVNCAIDVERRVRHAEGRALAFRQLHVF